MRNRKNQHPPDKKPCVIILATGGTIAGSAASPTQAGYASGRVTVETMIGAVPGLPILPVSMASRWPMWVLRTSPLPS
jgi:L-asparaginase/Glu-tRNA(Gln) amidotransferase subunit D